MIFASEFKQAFTLVFTGDADLWEIIFFSLRISLTALFFASIFAIISAVFLAIINFPGKNFIILCLNAMMGLPPVFIGLLLYILFSHAGPFGVLELLYQPKIMILAQTLLIFPIMTALAVDLFSQNYPYYRPLFDNLCLTLPMRAICLIVELRMRLVILFVAGLGRALSEVGAVAIVGGNINHFTRTMTTAIILETSRGNIGFALGLGSVLVSIGILLNILLLSFKQA